jgi:hypothetical protein
MNKEQQELLDEAYENFVKSVENNRPAGYVRKVITKSDFMKESNFNKDFREYWGLKIEEKELNGSERYTIARQYGLCPKYSNIGIENCTEEEHYNKYNVPTKLITITYNDKKIESYEN